jgi:hypothetical protein
MASVNLNVKNGASATTEIHAGGQSISQPFGGPWVLVADAFPVFALSSAMKGQSIDGVMGRAFNDGRGVVGQGGNSGPGVVGIAGGVIPNPDKFGPGPLDEQLARGFHVGVVGFGTDLSRRREGSGGEAVGVLGIANKSVGVWGSSTAMPGVLGVSAEHAGLYGWSQTTGVIGDGNAGQCGVEGFGNSYGVYGHVNYANPNPDGIGVFGAAGINLNDLDNPTGRAGVFAGPVDVLGKLTVTGDLVVWGMGKSAAARHTDGSHRLLYCTESPESQFEDFGEAQLVKGRAQVRLDRDFAGVADTRHYHVFLTPYGDSKGLYVSGRNRQGFVVREQGGGVSRIRFSYRIVARRRNATAKRFQKVSAPKMPKLPGSLVRPDVELKTRKKGTTRRRPAHRRATRK